jgi:hypothetical protein
VVPPGTFNERQPPSLHELSFNSRSIADARGLNCNEELMAGTAQSWKGFASACWPIPHESNVYNEN